MSLLVASCKTLLNVIGKQSMVAFQNESFKSSVKILDTSNIQFIKEIQYNGLNSYHHKVAAPYIKSNYSISCTSMNPLKQHLNMPLPHCN